MRIDAHQHFWKYNEKDYSWMDDRMDRLRTDRLPGNLKPLLDACGIDGTVAVQARQTPQETAWLLELAAANDFIKGVVGWVDLRSERVDEQLERLAADAKLKGVRHVLHDEPDDRFMLGGDFIRGIARLEPHGLTYDILIFPRHLKYASELAGRFPAQPFVVDHIAKPEIREGRLEPWRRDMRKLAAAPNVCCKLSGMVTEADWENWKKRDLLPYMEETLEMFGPERLMFGSDWPVCTVAAAYERVFETVYDFVQALSPTERDAILGTTAAGFYGL
jgi:L-fuconolactonase